ncbi:hypothetical protein HMPREF1544_08020 [Mucor circinelloides 1006PhL]|uniref:Uncharacterized protein n=1 Tax=Mucor circinelloides f. circinelloides (strain 1006PhL) TaxID=1220926 RepID=S2JRE6_MUCC1|nr:hypothetical protein HMPREF1544_08020 [Mucor circinelloides 1006PhL]
MNEVMARLDANLINYERRLRSAIASPSSHVPSALLKLDISKKYRSMMYAEGHGLYYLLHGLKTEGAVNLIEQKFVEFVLLSNEETSVLIPQTEIYYNDQSVDDTSINSIKLTNDEHALHIQINKKQSLTSSLKI